MSTPIRTRLSRTTEPRLSIAFALGLLLVLPTSVRAQDPVFGEDPYVAGGAAPLLSGLEGDPAAIGLLPGTFGGFADLKDYVAAAPAGNSELFLVLKTAGPVTAPTGYSLAVLVNTGKIPLKNPKLFQAIGDDAPPLATIPTGGGPSQVLSELAPGRVFVANLPDGGGDLFVFGHDGKLFKTRVGMGQSRADLPPAALPGTTCFGAVPYGGNAVSAFVYNPTLAAGLLGNLLPATWNQNAYVPLDLSPGGSDWNVSGISGNTPQIAVAGSRVVGASRQAVVWSGPLLAATDLAPGPGTSGSEASGVWSDGSAVAVAGSFVASSTGLVLPARWDLQPTVSSVFQLTPLEPGIAGGRASAVSDTLTVGSVNGFFGPVPTLWSGGNRYNLADPATGAAALGGEALAVDGVIAGFVTSGGVQRATAWVPSFAGFIGGDLHPAGFVSSSAVATRANFVVGVGRDAGGAEHVLWWDINNPVATDLTPYLPVDWGTARPTSVDDQGNVTVVAGEGGAAKAFLLVRGGAGISEPGLIKIGKTELDFTVDVATACEGATVRVRAYDNGTLAATWESNPISAGTGPVNLRPILTLLTPETYYVVQTVLVRPSGDEIPAPSVTVRTQPKNLPPSAPPLEIFYRVGADFLVLTTPELIAGAVDPEGDAIRVDHVDSSMNLILDPQGDPATGTFVWTPPGAGFRGVDDLHVYLADSQGAMSERQVRLRPAPGAAAKGSVSGGSVKFAGEAGNLYRVESTDALATPGVWKSQGDVVAKPDGTIDVPGLAVETTGQKFYRAIAL